MNNNQQNVFITGKITGAGIAELGEFALAQKLLEEQGYEHVTTAADDLPVGDKSENDPMKDAYIKQRAKNLAAAEVVLLLVNYDQDPDAISDFNIANASHSKLVYDAKKYIDAAQVAAIS